MRESGVDAFSRPVRNLLTNPSCETAGGAVAVWKNLMLNPTAETVLTGTTTLRTNLVTNPYCATANTGWGAYFSQATSVVTRVATGGPTNGPFSRATITTTTGVAGVGGATYLGRINSTTPIAVTPGLTYTASVWVRTSFAAIVTNRVEWTNNASGNTGASGGANTTVPANTWTRVSVTAVAPAGTDGMVVTPYHISASRVFNVGETFDATMLLVEQTDQVRPYFDGDTVDSKGWDYGWSGVASASISTAKAGAGIVRTNYLTNPSLETVATGTTTLRTNAHPNPAVNLNLTGWSSNSASMSLVRWATGGPTGVCATFARLTINTVLTSSPAALNAAPGGASSTVAVLEGATYTFSAYTRTSFAGLSNIRLDVSWYTSSGALLTSLNGATVPFVANNWERKSVTATAPATAAWASISIAYSGPQAAPVGTTFDATAVLVEQTDQLRPYFDGDTVDARGWDYGWSGTVGTSTSTAKANPVTFRTNLATDPRGLTTTFGYGTQVVTPNIAVSGHPLGIATAVRVSYDTGNPNPGINFPGATALAAGTYSLSAYIYVETPTTGAAYGLAAFGLSAQTGVSIPVSTWTRLTWTVTTSDVRSMGVRLGGTPGTAGSFLVTGITVEATSAVGSYFDGATPASGDVTHAWTGTVNASTSVQRGVQIVAAVGGGGAAVISSVNTDGTRSARITSTHSASTDTYFHFGDTGALRNGMVAGNTYTVSGTIRLPAAQTGTISTSRARRIVVFTSTGTGYVETPSTAALNQAGSTRLSVTFTVPVGATEAFIRFYNGANGGVDVFWDDLLLTDGTDGTYFDGDSQSFGDFSHQWTGGAVHNATSLEVTPTFSAPGTYSVSKIASLDPTTGTRSFRVRSTRADQNEAMCFLLGAFGNIPAGVVVGGTYTLIAKVRVPSVMSTTRAEARTIQLRWNGPGVDGYVRSTQAPNVPGTYELRVTATVPAGATGVMVQVNHYGTTADPDLYFDDVALIEGNYPSTLPYFDGDTPLVDSDFTTVWTGTAHNSVTEVRGVSVAGFTNQGVLTSIKAIQSSQWASSGAKSVRLISSESATSPNGFVGISNQSGWLAGQTYTAMGRVRISTTQTGALRSESRRIQVRTDGGITVAVSDQPPNLPGVYDVRLVFTMPSGSKDIRFYNGGTAGGGDVWWDDLMLVEGVYNGPYIDGTSYDCIWEGTAHASASKGFPPSPLLIRNLVINPSVANPTVGWTYNPGSGTADSSRVATGGPTGGPFMRATFTSAGGSEPTWYYSSAQVREGNTYTASGWVRTSVAATMNARIRWVSPTGSFVGGDVNGTASTLVAGQWTRISVTAVAPVGAVQATILLRGAGAPFVVGSTSDATNYSMTLGSTLYEFADGNTPGWRWEGAAGASTSIGYPLT